MIDLSRAGRTLAAAIAECAHLTPAARLVIHSDRRPADLTLDRILERAQHVAAHLARLGVAPGDVVAVQLPAWAEWAVACVAINHIGAVMLPVVSIYGPKEVGFILRDSCARVLVTPDRTRTGDARDMVTACGDLPALLHHVVIGDAADGAVAWDDLLAPIGDVAAVDRAPDDLAMIVYTSGTTSDPKGVRHSHRTLLSELLTGAETRRHITRERILSPWPPGHVAGVCTFLRLLVDGVDLVAMDGWDAGAAARLIDEHGASTCSFTPFHLAGLLDAADRDGRSLSSLESVMVGAAPVPPSLIERCAARNMHTFRCYGSSEMPTVTSGTPTDPIAKRLSTEGRPMPGAEIRFVDEEGNDVYEGELAVRGPELFLGYTDPVLDRAAFLPGGWFRTGDIGRFDADGFLRITDRKKDIIIRGGENISSREVEDILFHHPEIREAAVVAAPDERMGEMVCAFLIPASGAAPTLAGIQAYFREAGVARQKTPERIVLVDDFPRNSTGKTLKHELRTRARALAPQPAG